MVSYRREGFSVLSGSVPWAKGYFVLGGSKPCITFSTERGKFPRRSKRRRPFCPLLSPWPSPLSHGMGDGRGIPQGQEKMRAAGRPLPRPPAWEGLGWVRAKSRSIPTFSNATDSFVILSPATRDSFLPYRSRKRPRQALRMASSGHLDSARRCLGGYLECQSAEIETMS